MIEKIAGPYCIFSLETKRTSLAKVRPEHYPTNYWRAVNELVKEKVTKQLTHIGRI